jgi:SNF family Na+-dependent transporter
VLHKSKSIEEYGSINFPLAFFFLLSLYICYECIKRGVKVSGSILIFTVVLPYVFITALTIRGWQLEGSELGIQYLFSPDWSKLLRPKIWIEALIQVFFQLAVASGGVICYGSKKPRNEPFLSILYIVPIGLIVCGLLSGLVVFMYVGHFCHTNGTSINELSLSGLELVFNVFPKAISILPWPNIWFLIFCVVLILLGIDSMFGFLELVSQALQF